MNSFSRGSGAARRLALLCFLLHCPLFSSAAPAAADELLRQAAIANGRMDPTGAIALVTKAIELEPKNPKTWTFRGQLYEQTRQDAKAVEDYDKSLQLQTNLSVLYQRRGWLHFRLAHFNQSIADFDRFLELEPSQAANHWQRGIVCYYAGRFEAGRKQFELHQTVNNNDVENAVWHYLCIAREAGLAKARASLIPIQKDTRVPMMQVHALFAGKAETEEVLAAARAGTPSPTLRDQQLFYANLYLGLYYEATGDDAKARHHIFKAADEFNADHAMGDVARVHAAVLRKKQKPQP